MSGGEARALAGNGCGPARTHLGDRQRPARLQHGPVPRSSARAPGAKMALPRPLMDGGALFETGAGRLVPQARSEFVRRDNLRWDSLASSSPWRSLSTTWRARPTTPRPMCSPEASTRSANTISSWTRTSRRRRKLASWTRAAATSLARPVLGGGAGRPDPGPGAAGAARQGGQAAGGARCQDLSELTPRVDRSRRHRRGYFRRTRRRCRRRCAPARHPTPVYPSPDGGHDRGPTASRISRPRSQRTPTSSLCRRGIAADQRRGLTTARTPPHGRLFPFAWRSDKLPIDARARSSTTSGPTHPRPGDAIGSVVPTTASRHDKFTPAPLSRRA